MALETVKPPVVEHGGGFAPEPSEFFSPQESSVGSTAPVVNPARPFFRPKAQPNKQAISMFNQLDGQAIIGGQLWQET